MAQRRTQPKRKRGMGTWGTVALLVVAVAALAWWLSARRAEAPGLPALEPGARALSEPPDAKDDHGHDEITGEEKADLDRIIRNGGTAKGSGK